VLASSLLVSRVLAQPVALSHVEILGYLAKGDLPSFIAHLVKNRGVSFSLTDSFLTQVKLAGGDGVLVEHLSSLDSSSAGTFSRQEDRPVEHFAKCAEFVHIGDIEYAEAECRASIQENPNSPWPLLIAADLLMRNGVARTPADPSNWDQETARAGAYNDLLKRAGDLDPEHLATSELEAGSVNPYQFLSNNAAPPPNPFHLPSYPSVALPPIPILRAPPTALWRIAILSPRISKRRSVN